MNKRPGVRTIYISSVLAVLLALLTALPWAADAGQPGQSAGSYRLVGLGPGDPDLMTPRQLKAIQEADLVFCETSARQMLAPKVDFTAKKVITGYGLLFPFYGKECSKIPANKRSRWGMTCEEYHKKRAKFVRLVRGFVAKGKKVVMASDGDPMIFGPCAWSVLELKDVDAKVVPGISSFNAANAALKVSLDDLIITAPLEENDDQDTIENLGGHDRATMIIFMPRDLENIRQRLAKVYPPDTPMAVVSHAGQTERQKVALGTIADIGPKLAGMDNWLSLVYVGQALARSQYQPAKPKASKAGKGKYYLVGVGPGDADLVSFRALKVIKDADLIFAHPRFKRRFASLFKGKKMVEGYHRLFPFYGTKCSKAGKRAKFAADMSCDDYHRKQAEFASMVRQAVAQGKTVATLDSGDPLVYGPCSWTLTELRDLDTEVVPGMSSFNAANAAIGASVTGGVKTHSVLLASGWTVDQMARHQASMVLFTMRTDLNKFVNSLRKYYAPETPVAIVCNAGYAKREEVMRGSLGSIVKKVEGSRLPFQHLLYVGDFLTNPAPY